MLWRHKIIFTLSDHGKYIDDVRLPANINEVVLVDNEPAVGGLVRSPVDDRATGMIVKFLSDEDVLILWSTPPRDLTKKFGEIW